MEPFALRLAMAEERYAEDDLAELESLALRLNELEKSPGKVYEIARTDVALHYLICSRSDHQLLLDAYRGLQSLTWLYVSHFQHYQTDAYSAAPSHLDIVQAIKGEDIDKATKLLEGHISRSGEALLASMGDPSQRRRLIR
jgi:DNA-binding GntR family transcriptional regulator